jgi:heme/copper-type cytochrome/quinol oxidase subunit 4
MRDLVRHRGSVVWVALVAATLVAWWLSADSGSIGGSARTIGSVTVLAVAMTKVRFVMREFMELRNAPATIRRLADTWIALVLTALVLTYLFA